MVLTSAFSIAAVSGITTKWWAKTRTFTPAIGFLQAYSVVSLHQYLVLRKKEKKAKIGTTQALKRDKPFSTAWKKKKTTSTRPLLTRNDPPPLEVKGVHTGWRIGVSDQISH